MYPPLVEDRRYFRIYGIECMYIPIALKLIILNAYRTTISDPGTTSPGTTSRLPENIQFGWLRFSRWELNGISSSCDTVLDQHFKHRSHSSLKHDRTFPDVYDRMHEYT